MEFIKEIEDINDEMINFRRDLHQYPEVSFEEYRTTQKIKERLLSHGITSEPLDMPTGLSVLIKGAHPGPTICVRHDIDALPIEEESGLPFASKNKNVCHSCGHDIHATIAVYTAIIINKYKASLFGNVRIVFQPAEETANGAHAMVKAGIMELKPKNDYVVGLHVSPAVPVGKISLRSGPAEAGSDCIEITIKGKSGHGAHPYACSDVILTAGYLLAQLQSVVSRENRAVKPTVLSFGSIHGGSSSNTLPSKVKLLGNLRSFYSDSREDSIEAIKRISECVCKSTNTKAEVKIFEDQSLPPVINDVDVINDIRLAAKQIIGPENIENMEFPSTGSDDFSIFLKECKGAQIFLGTADNDPKTQIGLHNEGIIFNEKSISIGVSLLVQYILNVIGK